VAIIILAVLNLNSSDVDRQREISVSLFVKKNSLEDYT